MLSIFHYSNYRTYIMDFYKKRCMENVHYSYGVLARKARLSKTQILLILRGSRNISSDRIYTLGMACGLSDSELDYFAILVLENQARDPQMKSLLKGQLNNFRFKMNVAMEAALAA